MLQTATFLCADNKNTPEKDESWLSQKADESLVGKTAGQKKN